MSNLAKAIELASRAHVAQRDKTGGPYVLHPLRLMDKVSGEDAKIVAVLHDVVEDTPVTEDELRGLGFSEAVIRAVLALTRRDDETYAQFVLRCKANPLALPVKLADLEDNYNLPRAMLREDKLEKDLRRLARYILSHKFLTGVLSESAYLQAMARIEESK